MTKDEAIQFIEEHCKKCLALDDDNSCLSTSKCFEAKRMAIEALSEPSNTPTESTNTPTNAPIEALKADVARWSSWNKTFEQSGIADLISRADAIDAVAEEWLSEASAESPYVNDNDIDRYRELAEELFADIPSADAEFADLPDIPRAYYERIVGNMAHEINMLKEQLESADAVHGEWIEVEDYNGDVHYKCDQCGEEWTFPFGTPKENNANFCPNCGSRMKDGDDE